MGHVIKFGDRLIGAEHPPYIIAEIGANHNGDMKLCREMIDAAIVAGADCVKFQSWDTKTLISKAEYQRNTDYGDSKADKHRHFGSLEDMVNTYQFTPEHHHEIAAYCRDKGVQFASSGFSEHEIDMLAALNVPFLKVASMDLNYHRLLRHMAKTGIPIVFSTGMGTLAEIETALACLREAGAKDIVLLHCRSTYPPKDSDNDLLNIPMLAQTFGLPVGLSDHSLGTIAPIAAAALGACVIEKHYTTDKTLPGWDHWMSVEPDELKHIVDGTRQAHAMLGQWHRRVTDDEKNKMLKFRRRAVATRALKKGEAIKPEDITFKRPGNGIHPHEEAYIVGRVAKHDIAAEAELTWQDVL
jgi:N-acetylneuraminate synthase